MIFIYVKNVVELNRKVSEHRNCTLAIQLLLLFLISLLFLSLSHTLRVKRFLSLEAKHLNSTSNLPLSHWHTHTLYMRARHHYSVNGFLLFSTIQTIFFLVFFMSIFLIPHLIFFPLYLLIFGSYMATYDVDLN